MHGNEVVGRELMLHLIQVLLEGYKREDDIQHLVDETRIHILPSMNPDGWEMSVEGDCNSEKGRGNWNGYDLNRDFPDQFKSHLDHPVQVKTDQSKSHLDHPVQLKTDKSKYHLDHPVQVETGAVIEWIHSIPFVLSANLHGGSLVANYPFDGNRDFKDQGYEGTPDDATFRMLALAYSKVGNGTFLEHS